MLNYKLFAIASVFTFTAVAPSTFASASQTEKEIFPNSGCLRVVKDLKDRCEFVAVVDGVGEVDWFGDVMKIQADGGCGKGNWKPGPGTRRLNPVNQIRGRALFRDREGMGGEAWVPRRWAACETIVKGARKR